MIRNQFLRSLSLSVILFSLILPTVPAYATEEIDSEETEYEEEVPEAYYWNIETNELKNWPAGPQVEAEGASVIDVDTGAFLYAKNMDAKLYPASITKIMTTLVAIENTDSDKLDKKIKASEEALSTIGPDSSQIYLSVGEKITMRSALYAIMLESANDAANVVAEKVGGSIENFVQMMNDKAKELGCVNTHFVNPHGLHDENHYTCARDMALITRAACQNKLFRKIIKTVEYRIPKTKYMDEDRWLLNHQKMLYEDDEYSYEGCIGGKTGFTDAAWNTLVTIAERDGRTLVSVELRVNGSWKTFRESAALLDYGFDNFRQVKMAADISNRTFGQLVGVCRFGNASCLDEDILKENVVQGDDFIAVTIPNNIKKSKLERTMTGGNTISYCYKGWELGSEKISFFNPIITVKQPEAPETEDRSAGLQTGESADLTEAETESKGFKEKVDGYMGKLTDGIIELRNLLEQWMGSNEMIAAIVVFILILLLIPLLVIAFVRDRRARISRRERRREREELRKIEESIDSKSVQEIENEIRAELERERLARERQARRKREAEEEERRMAEMESLIDMQSKPSEQKSESASKDVIDKGGQV